MKIQPLFRPATIRPVTEADYLKKIDSMRAYSVKKRTLVEDEPASPSFTDAVGDLASREDISVATRAGYRAAALWFARSGRITDPKDLQESVAILEAIETRRPRKGTRGTPRTIPEADLNLLLQTLDAKQEISPWARRTAIWIRATIITGARPIEWLHASWCLDRPDTLLIRNAKTKASAPAFMREPASHQDEADQAEEQQRLEDTQLAKLIALELSEEELAQDQLNSEDDDSAEHIYREIKIEDEDDLRVVQLQIQSARSAAPLGISIHMRRTGFKRYHKRCIQVLARSCQDLWGGSKPYTLYTMRGQFAANMKAKFGAGKASELMGHSREDSPAAAHYGKGNQGFDRFKKSKSPERQAQAPNIPGPRNAPTTTVE